MVALGSHGWYGTADAQSLADRRARVAHLTERMRTLAAVADSIRQHWDTVEVGGIYVLAKPDQVERAQAVLQLVVTELDATFGPQDRKLIDGWYAGVIRFDADDLERPSEVASRLASRATHTHFAQIGGRALARWASWWDFREDDLEAAFLGLVTSLSPVATRCYEGSLPSCRIVLEIDSVADPWLELFDAESRRAWVARWEDRFRSYRSSTPLLSRCLVEEVDNACVQILRIGWVRAPLLSQQTRRSIVFVARSLGGDGMYERLVADSLAPLGDRLASAAGVPLDSLMQAWHTAVRASAPAGSRTGPALGWLSTALVVGLGALSLRSTRWRLG